MRRAAAAVLTTGLLAGSVIPVLAEDDVTDEGTGAQRIEVPEAGLAVSLPAGWNADIEMRENEDWGLYDEGFADEPVPFWNVIYASDGGRPWCDLTWYPSHPLTLDAHAQRYEALMTPSTEVERSIEVSPVALPAGEAYRFAIYNEPSATHTTVYLLAAGDAHYLLQCVDDEWAEDDWLAYAESLELFEDETAEGAVE
jgi:hypothetical protein